METRASYALIGASVLIGLFAIGAFVLWLGQLQFNRSFAEYNVVFDGAVNGLSEGGQVRYLGINVGEVADLSISDEDSQQVVARIRIEADTPVRTDSTAILDFAGLTGVTFIQIRPGTPQAARLPVRMGGDNLPEIATERTPLEEIFQGGQDVMANAQITLSRLNAILDTENTEAFKQTLGNLQTITGALAGDEQILMNASKALESLARAGDAVGNAADSFKEVGDNVKSDLAGITESAKGLIDDARQAVGMAEKAVTETQASFDATRKALEEPTEQTVEEVRRLASEMRVLVRRLDSLAREVERNPQAFIQGQAMPYRESD